MHGRAGLPPTVRGTHVHRYAKQPNTKHQMLLQVQILYLKHLFLFRLFAPLQRACTSTMPKGPPLTHA
jgi:hypothetical protein